MPPMGQPFMSWIDFHAVRTPDKVAMVDLASGRELTYAELSARVRALAYQLETRFGIQAGDRVAVLSRNDARCFEVLYACAHVGAVCVLLNWRLSPMELAAIVADTGPTLLVAETAAAQTAHSVAATATMHVLLWASEPGEADTYERLTTEPLPAQWRPRDVDEDAVWTIIYTSGTTGTPKGVTATHRNVAASMLSIALIGEVDAHTRCLTVLPTFHVAGLNLFANPTLLHGGTVVVMRTFDAATTLALLAKAEDPVTHFCGVPANYQFLQQLPEFPSTELRPFTAAVGGSPVPQALTEAWAARGVPLMKVFGITEAGACVLAMPPGESVDKNATVGVPVLHARCRVTTADEAPAAPGETGELQIAGPLVTPAYWNRPDATCDAFTDDGWLHTGDAAQMDADGYVLLVDRWKDMYISGGVNVYPAEVENVLHNHPEVSQAAVVGVPHPRWGETGVAFVVSVRSCTPAPEELTGWCSSRLASYKVPSHIYLVEELPRNATGKVLKAALREAADIG